MEKEITVLIPSYNPGAYLKEAVGSVFQQSYPYWKLIIVDDASTDHSLSTIQDYMHDSRVKLIKNKENMGQSISMNKGLDYVDSEFFMLLDSDDWLCHDSLERLHHETFKISQDTALIVSNVNVFIEKDGTRGNYIARNPAWGASYPNRYEILRANLFPWQKFYRTSIIKEIGKWPTDDPYKGRYVEDLRIFLRIIENYRFHWMDQVVYNYRLHDSNKTNQREIIAQMVEWIIRDALIRWGNLYEPEFKVTEDGWKFLGELKPIKKEN